MGYLDNLMAPTMSSSNGAYSTDFWSPEQWQQFGGSGGTIGDNGQLLGGIMTGDMSSTAPGSSLNMNNLFGDASMSDITGLAGLLMQGYNSFFGPQADLMDQQIGMLKDQRGANKLALANQAEFNKNWAEGSNKVMNQPTGLAASAVQPKIG